MHLNRRSGRYGTQREVRELMVARRRLPVLLVPLILLAVKIVAVPLAHAAPPDALWVSGCYDAADLDESIVAALSGVATTGARKAYPRVDTVTISRHVAQDSKPADTIGAPIFERAEVPRPVALPHRPIRSPPAP